jgi:hypothetical protein
MMSGEVRAIQQFAHAVCDKLRKDMNNLCDDMANGAAKDFADYKRACGLIAGLGRAEEYVKELAQTVLKEEDDDDDK